MRAPLLLVAALLVGAVAVVTLLVRGGARNAASTGEAVPVARPVSVAPAPLPGQVAAPAQEAPPPADAGALPVPGGDPLVARNNEAARLLEAGELERALAGFRACHEGRPEDDVFRRNLAEAHVRLARRLHEERELSPAIEHLARALELAPDRADAEALAALLARWRTEHEIEADHWSEGSDLFTLSFDTDRRDILHDSQAVLDHLEASYEELRLWFGADPVREGGRAPIRVVLYDPEEFDRITGLGDWAGGVFDGTVRVSVADLRAGAARWKATLKHELVHAFVHELGGPAVPGWLNEGLAQLLEGAPGRLAAARARLAGTPPFPLERLAGSLAGWDDPAAIGRAYAQSLLFTADLQRRYGAEALRRMVLAAGRGDDLPAAFEAWAAVPLPFAFDTWRATLR